MKKSNWYILTTLKREEKVDKERVENYFIFLQYTSR